MYGYEKFLLAVEGLESTSSDQRKALQDVYLAHILHVQEHDLPNEVLEDYRLIVKAVTLPDGVDPIGGHSGCFHAVSNLSDTQVEETIARIYCVFEKTKKIEMD